MNNTLTDNAGIAPFQSSPWPLANNGQRTLIPAEKVNLLNEEPRSQGLYPHGFGYYPKAHQHQMMRSQHHDNLVIYCIEGHGDCWLVDSQGEDNQHFHIRAGDFLVLPKGQAHRYKADMDTPWSIFWMHLGGRLSEHWLATFTQDGPVTSIGLNERLVQEFRSLLDSSDTGYRLDALLVAASQCQQIIAYAAMLAERQPRSGQDEAMTRLHAYMDTHLHERLTLKQLAHAYQSTSSYQFIREYQQQTGQTPMQAFTHRKMARACYLLEVSHDTVAVIGQQLGFDDPYYFSRAFKRIVGVSPRQYRNKGQVKIN